MTSSLRPATTAKLRDLETDAPALRERLTVLWRYRGLIAVCTLLGGAIAVATALLAPRTYEAEAALQVIRPKTGEALSLGEQIAQANYRPLIENRAIAEKVIQDTGLDKPPYLQSPGRFFPDVVEIEEVRNSAVFLVKGRLHDRALVATVVNRVADLAVDRARRMSQQEALLARNDIKAQLDEAKARLENATLTLRQFRTQSQIEVVKADVASALTQRTGLLDLLIGIETERARLSMAQEELKKRPRAESVTRSIDSDPALLEAARSAQTGSRELLGLQLKTEVLSAVYEDLDRQIATSRTKLAAMEKQKAQMDARKLTTPQLAQLTDLYAKESEIARLEMERDLAKRVYEAVSTSYETARLLVAGRSSALHVISGALTPDTPAPRRAGRAVVIGAMSGLLLSVFAALTHATFTRPRILPGEHRQ